jgi:hypothetical protein
MILFLNKNQLKIAVILMTLNRSSVKDSLPEFQNDINDK